MSGSIERRAFVESGVAKDFNFCTLIRPSPCRAMGIGRDEGGTDLKINMI